jgi:hypothetical protein
MNTNESVWLVNNTTFDTRLLAGAESSLRACVLNDAAFPEAFEDVFALEVVTRPSGSKYGVLRFA